LDGIEISKQTPASELLKTIFVIEVGDSKFKVFPPSGHVRAEKFHQYFEEAKIPISEAQTIYQFLSRIESKFD
jgi:hypothetical protein